MELIPEAKWNIAPLPHDFSHHRMEYAAYCIIALVDCSPLEITRNLQWLQSVSYQLHFPVLLLVDEETPIIHQQTPGTHSVVPHRSRRAADNELKCNTAYVATADMATAGEAGADVTLKVT
ncbi:hypothetical protein UXN93_21040 [Enterobacter hormaechei]